MFFAIRTKQKHGKPVFFNITIKMVDEMMLTQIQLKIVWKNVIRIHSANIGILSMTSVDYVLMKVLVVWFIRVAALTDKSIASLVSSYENHNSRKHYHQNVLPCMNFLIYDSVYLTFQIK